jgi:D-alanine-D-alanine ligase
MEMFLMEKTKVVILAGGSSTEREISFQTSEEMYKNLDKNKYDIDIISIPNDSSNQWVIKLINSKPNIVISALHGGDGEDGTVQGLLECLNIKYIGTKVLGSALGMDKYLSKQIMKLNHIPVAEDVFILKNEELCTYEEEVNKLGYPLVVKPNKGGSSIGISIVNDYDALIKAIDIVKALGEDILIERYIQGREVTCGLVEGRNGVEVLTVLDIDSNSTFYDYRAKYEDDTTKIVFSTLPKFLQDMIQEIAKKVFVTLKCRGYARVDMIVKEEQIVVLEINTLPGMTSHSLIPKAIQGKGSSYSEFLNSLIEFEMNGQI